MNNENEIKPASCTTLFPEVSRSLNNTPSISDTFIDSGFARQRVAKSFDAKTTATLLPIESVLSTGATGIAEQTRSFSGFLAPLLENLQTSDRCSRLIHLHNEQYANNSKSSFFEEDNNTEFLRFLPVVEALERSSLPKEMLDDLPACATGTACYVLGSALRYGACLEIINKIVAGTAATDGNGNSRAICEVPRLGKIRAWQFDPDTRSGSLFVDDMKVDRYTFRYDSKEGVLKATLVEQWSYDWTIEVGKKGYTLAKRLNQREFMARLQTDANADPFVDVNPSGNTTRPALPAGAKDFLNPDSIWGRGLTGRLFAQGTDIAIKSVTGKRYAMKPLEDAGATAILDTAYTAADGTRYFRDHVVEGNVVLDSSHAMLQTSEDSCIDIMFALPQDGTFPTSIEEFPESQSGWCMGRCSSPLIANSR